jgi:hypothetical protein
MAYTRDWDETEPDGSTVDADTIDTVIQNLKSDISERVDDLFGTDLASDQDPLALTKLGTAAVVASSQIKPTLYAAGNSSTNLNIDWNNGVNQTVTLTGNWVATFTNPVAGTDYSLIISQDGTGGRSVTFPATVRWTNAGSAPTLVTTLSRVSRVFLYYTGSVYLASLGGTGYNVS